MAPRTPTAPRRLLVALAVAVVVTASACEPTPDALHAAAAIDAARRTASAPPLRLDGDLSTRATVTAARLRDEWVAAGCPRDAGRFLVHTADLPAHYRPQAVVGRWARIGENIGVANLADPADPVPGIDALQRAYLASTEHRANLLDARYTHLGLGFAAGPTAEQRAACPTTPAGSFLFNAQVFVK